MKHFSNQSFVRSLAMICGLLILSACTATSTKKNSIEERVNERWAALLNDKIDVAYEYLSPGYRSSVSLKQYHRSLLLQRVKWTSAKYIKSQCEEATCEVKVLVGYTIYGAVPGIKSYSGTQNIDESWVLIDGNWYMLPER